MAQLIAAKEHRDTLRKEQGSDQIALLTFAQNLNGRGIGRSLFAAVPGVIVIGPVAVLLSISLVVLRVITHQVLQGKAVMAGDEVNARMGTPPFVLIKIAAPTEARRKFRYRAAISFPKTPNVISVAAIPFGPENR